MTVWIDAILAESDDRMLMMDFDEDNGELQYNTIVLLVSELTAWRLNLRF